MTKIKTIVAFFGLLLPTQIVCMLRHDSREMKPIVFAKKTSKKSSEPMLIPQQQKSSDVFKRPSKNIFLLKRWERKNSEQQEKTSIKTNCSTGKYTLQTRSLDNEEKLKKIETIIFHNKKSKTPPPKIKCKITPNNKIVQLIKNRSLIDLLSKYTLARVDQERICHQLVMGEMLTLSVVKKTKNGLKIVKKIEYQDLATLVQTAINLIKARKGSHVILNLKAHHKNVKKNKKTIDIKKEKNSEPLMFVMDDIN